MIEIPPASPYAFGASVAACDDTLFVGAPYRDYAGRIADGESLAPPSACMYIRAGGVWQLVGAVTAADPLASEGFGRTVALTRSSMAVGAPGHDNGDGPVHAFDRQLHPGPLFDSPDRVDDLFVEYGVGLAADEQRIVVGAPLEDDSGAVYDFDRGGVTTLRGSTPKEGFGRAVALSGDVLVVGADGAFSNERLAGACYVYRRDASGQWIEHCRVAGRTPGEQFGFAVAVDGARFAVGAPGRAGIPRLAQGRVEVYELAADGCTQIASMSGTASFGAALALGGARLAIGQPMFGADQTGRVGLVRLPTTTISWLAAPSARPFARLGASVSIGPDYVAAGMPGLGRGDSSGRVIVEAF